MNINQLKVRCGPPTGMYMRQTRGSLEIRDGACGFQTVEESGLNICSWEVFGRNYRCWFNFSDQFFGFARFGSKTVKIILAEKLGMESGTLKQSRV